MKGDEYDFFLDGLAGYMLRVYFPRVCGAMEAFKLLPPLSSLGYSYRGALTLAEALIKPEIATAIETLQKIGSELERWRSRMDSFGDEIEKNGLPEILSGHSPGSF